MVEKFKKLYIDTVVPFLKENLEYKNFAGVKGAKNFIINTSSYESIKLDIDNDENLEKEIENYQTSKKNKKQNRKPKMENIKKKEYNSEDEFYL